MHENDAVFFNLHRRYLDQAPEFGGFMGIYYLAAFLNQNGYQAQAYAGQLMRGKELLDEICRLGKARFVGLYCDFENVTENLFLARHIKETYDLPVIVGGPQATALGEKFLRETGCVALVCHEGEMTVLELADHLIDGTGTLSEIRGIRYLMDGEMKETADRPVIENLDALPLVTVEEYLVPKHIRRSLSIMTGRGCPFHCSFCYEGHHTRKVRFRSVDHVFREIEAYLSIFSPEDQIYLLFTDDTFTLVPSRVQEICMRLKKLQEKYRIAWFCEGHIHTLYQHPEMIEEIASAGCCRIQLGIEAGTQPVLDAYRKGCTPAEIEAVVMRCRDAGIGEIFGNIIIGGAHFSREIYEADKSFAKHLLTLGEGTVELGVVTYWPLPGTAITKHPENYGLVLADTEFLTSVGDFPQTETGELNRWEIASMVQELRRELEAHSRDMLCNALVPDERILGWMNRDTAHTGMWLQVLYKIPHYYAFYHLRACGEAIALHSVGTEERWSLHPMRTFPLYLYDMGGGTHRLRYFGHEYTGLILDVLIYAAGKLAVREIAERLAEEVCYREQGGKSLAHAVMEAILLLEKRKLIVFSRY